MRAAKRRLASVVVALGTSFGAVVTVGVPTARAATPLRVPGDFTSIQAAVDAAQPGTTISVADGTYIEEIVVAKNLTIVGSGPARTVIKAPPVLSSYGVHLPTGRKLTAIVRISHGARVQLSGVTVTGPIPCGVEVTGVHALQGASLDFSNAAVTRIQPDSRTCPPQQAAGRAVVFGTPPHIVVDGANGSTAFGRISRVAVDHYQHAGISVTGPTRAARSDVTVADNVVTGGWSIPSFQYGVHVSAGATARVVGNTITGNVCGGPFCGPDPISEAQGTGVLLLDLAGPVEVSGNRLSTNEAGVYQVISPNCCTISGNRLSDNTYFGVVIQDGDGRARGNVIAGGMVGIAVVADAVDTTGDVRGNSITGTSVAPVREIECCGFDATAVLNTGGGHG